LLAHEALQRLDSTFEEFYAGSGRPSLPPEQLLLALLLQAIYGLRSDIQNWGFRLCAAYLSVPPQRLDSLNSRPQQGFLFPLSIRFPQAPTKAVGTFPGFTLPGTRV